jgi:hypothetical protein
MSRSSVIGLRASPALTTNLMGLWRSALGLDELNPRDPFRFLPVLEYPCNPVVEYRPHCGASSEGVAS